MKLIANWKQLHKLSSVQIAMVIALLGSVQATLPSLELPASTYGLINMGLGIAVAIARIIMQPSVSPEA